MEKPRRRWLDNVGNDRSKMDVKGWRKIYSDRDDWKLILKGVRALPGP